MNYITFSHDYYKLPKDWPGTEATLLAVQIIRMSHLRKICPRFLEEEAKYRDDPGSYDLNFEDGILLVLAHKKTGILFTTIRQYAPTKFAYYRSALFTDFSLRLITPEVR